MVEFSLVPFVQVADVVRHTPATGVCSNGQVAVVPPLNPSQLHWKLVSEQVDVLLMAVPFVQAYCVDPQTPFTTKQVAVVPVKAPMH